MTDDELNAAVAKRYAASMRRTIVHTAGHSGFYARILVIGEHVLLVIPMPGSLKAAEALADELNAGDAGVRVEPR